MQDALSRCMATWFVRGRQQAVDGRFWGSEGLITSLSIVSSLLMSSLPIQHQDAESAQGKRPPGGGSGGFEGIPHHLPEHRLITAGKARFPSAAG